MLEIRVSTIPEAGDGAFLRERVRAWEYIIGNFIELAPWLTFAEYTGRIQEKWVTELRTMAYNAHKRTYIFDLNEEQDLDAASAGSKARWINHTSTASLVNCRAIPVRIENTYYIVIQAIKDIAAGTELLYEYNMSGTAVPDELAGRFSEQEDRRYPAAIRGALLPPLFPELVHN